MTNFKNIVTGIVLTAIISFSATFANAGILLGDKTAPNAPTCTQPTDTKGGERVDSGILVSDLTGIVVAGFTGIVVAGFTGIVVAGKNDGEVINCGIVVAG